MAKVTEPTLLAVDAADELRHAVRGIYPDGHSKAACGVGAGADSPRLADTPVSEITCKVCRGWAEGE